MRFHRGKKGRVLLEKYSFPAGPENEISTDGTTRWFVPRTYNPHNRSARCERAKKDVAWLVPCDARGWFSDRPPLPLAERVRFFVRLSRRNGHLGQLLAGD
jgi:hypothetical protein